jgi:ribulose-phosphate 3-epimerase
LILPEFISAGASYITVHQESVRHLDKVINSIKEKGIKAGVSVNPSTPVETLKHLLHLVDLILIMSVNPGFGGQTFLEYTLEKVRYLKKIREENKFSYQIEIDGGINADNIVKVKDAGCDIIVAGTAIFKSKDIIEETTKLKNLIL